MFAWLGNITIDIIESPDSYTAKRAYDYAEHKVVEAKPALQWIYDGLEELKFEFKMHVAYTNPATGIQNLRQAASAHQILPLIFGNGYHRGKFVIIELEVDYQSMSDLGDLIYIIVHVTLKEIVPDTPINPQVPNFVPPGLQQPSDLPTDPTQPTLQPTMPQSGLTPLLNSSGPSTPFVNDFTTITASAIVRSPS
jgi:phage protein U